MVDRERVSRLLDRTVADLHKLRRYRGSRPGGADEAWLDAVKYVLITAIEECTRVAHHLVVSEGWPIADSNAGAIRTLARQGVIAPATAEPVAAAAGLRNVLVHQYIDVDDVQVVADLDRLSDLEQFVSEVAAWVERQP
ncbi:MAG: DUF86 domain-containing protein [Pseudonocardia sp.]|nr:DUF86 domain-containing protein [Pseudonocardia sp.]